MKHKFEQALKWAKDKWVLLGGVLVALAAVLVVRPKNKVVEVARKNAEIDAKIYNLSQAAAKELDDKVEEIDRDTAAKVTKLRNSKKKASKKLEKAKEERVKELANKPATELANLLKPKKD